MTDVKTITINEKEYVLDDLSDAAKAQLVSLQVTDQEIIRLQQQQNIAQTARNAYAQALSAELPKDSWWIWDGTRAFADELAAKSLTDETTLGKQGNFALHATDDTSSLMAVSSSGLLLRGAGSSQEQIERTAWLFGFSTEGLGSLADKAETAALKDALESFV